MYIWCVRVRVCVCVNTSRRPVSVVGMTMCTVSTTWQDLYRIHFLRKRRSAAVRSRVYRTAALSASEALALEEFSFSDGACHAVLRWIGCTNKSVMLADKRGNRTRWFKTHMAVVRLICNHGNHGTVCVLNWHWYMIDDWSILLRGTYREIVEQYVHKNQTLVLK